MYFPDRVEGPADDEDVGEAYVEVVERPEGAALGKPRAPYGQARTACDSSTDPKDEASKWIEAEDEERGKEDTSNKRAKEECSSRTKRNYNVTNDS